MLVFTCSKCSKRLRVPPEQAGLLGRCPFCQAVVTAPPEKKPKKPPVRDLDVDEGGTLSKPTMKIDPEELIDMTAMVDIVFFLLIFFLVTSMAAVHSSMPTPVPEAKKDGQGAAQAADESDSGDVITVKISRDDTVEVEGVVVSDLSDLPVRFQRLRAKGGPHMSLLVIGHGDASHGRAVTVLDAGYEAGMEKVKLSVSDQDPDQ